MILPVEEVAQVNHILRIALAALPVFPNNRQSLAVFIRQRTKQYRMDNTEDRRVRSNPQRQSDNRNQRYRRILHQHSRAIAQVLQERCHRDSPLQLIFGLWPLAF